MAWVQRKGLPRLRGRPRGVPGRAACPVCGRAVPLSLVNRVGRHAYKDFVYPGLGVVQDRDEFYFAMRYSF